jgi:hypothetical protein
MNSVEANGPFHIDFLEHISSGLRDERFRGAEDGLLRSRA